MGLLPRLGSKPGYGLSHIRELHVFARLCSLGLLQLLLHVRRHRRHWKSSHGRRLRFPCFHAEHCLIVFHVLFKLVRMYRGTKGQLQCPGADACVVNSLHSEETGLRCVFERKLPRCGPPGRICWPPDALIRNVCCCCAWSCCSCWICCIVSGGEVYCCWYAGGC